MNAARHADEQTVGEEAANARRRPRDRGFHRPGGPALVARPEPLASAPPPAVPVAPQPAPAETPPAPAPAEERPDDTPAPARETFAAATATKPTARQGKGTNLPMPPARHTELRVQFNTKLRPATITRTKAFADHHQASIQDVVELALDEYLTRRGWPTGQES